MLMRGVLMQGFAARCIAILFLVSPAVFAGPATASAHEGLDFHANVAAIDPAQPSEWASAAAEPFGLDVVPVTGGELLTKWNSVTADIRAESDVLARCADATTPCPAAAQKFLEVVAQGRMQEGRARIGVVNRAINLAVRPMSDFAQWGVADRWSAPLATLTSGRGDCEDYAIAKYAALIAAGFAEDDLRLVIVRDIALGEDHAIVTARLDGSWIVLDNRRLTLVTDVEMQRVVPLFVLDHDGVKQFTPALVAGTPPTAPAVPAAPAALGF
jgi:predicted transglutaminase-like cysteine proteinase